MEDEENIIDDDCEDDEKLLCEAMFKAKEAFEQHFMNVGIDAAYYELELFGFTLDVDFKRMNHIVMKKAETKDVKECECGRDEKVYNMR